MIWRVILLGSLQPKVYDTINLHKWLQIYASVLISLPRVLLPLICAPISRARFPSSHNIASTLRKNRKKMFIHITECTGHHATFICPRDDDPRDWVPAISSPGKPELIGHFFLATLYIYHTCLHADVLPWGVSLKMQMLKADLEPFVHQTYHCSG